MKQNINIQNLLKQAYLDFDFSYKVQNRPFENSCRVRFFNLQPQVIVLTELKGGGMSVTNSVEHIIPQLERFLLIEKTIAVQCDCVFIEHYDENSYYAPEDNEETFDRVFLLDNRPGWRRLTKNEVFLFLTKAN